MALTLDATGSVTALTIADSACVEADGTYALIFTGANTTAATGTYTIVSNVITAVSLTAGGSGYAAAPTVATQTGDGSVTATFLSLATAQDNQSRHPLVEIISSQRNADIPFDGSFLTPETFNEFGTNIIPHSSGRLAIAYCYGPDSDSDCGIKYVYTDTSRLEFSTVTIELYTAASYIMMGVSLCEMSDGNIGLVYLVNDTANHVYRLLRRIITVTGTAISDAEIANWSHDTFTSDPWVQTIGTNSYLLVYGKKSGSDYYIYKRTSSDFVTWSTESALSIAGLTSTWRLSNPSILKISTGDLWLWFDVLESTSSMGDELTNIYYSVSSDSGMNWGTAVKTTAYDAYSEVALHPLAIQKAANQMHLMFTRKVGALHMDDAVDGWPTGDYSYELSWDSTNRKLYVINTASLRFQNVTRVDVDTWTAEKYWDLTTTPAFPALYSSQNAARCRCVHDGHHIVVFAVGSGSTNRFLSYLDGESDTITNYYFDTVSALSVTANVSSVPTGVNPGCVQVDMANNRIIILFNGFYGFCVGYLDLTEITDYEYHEIIPYYNGLTGNLENGCLGYYWNAGQGDGGMYFDAATNYIVISGGCDIGNPLWIDGFCLVFDSETGALIKQWRGEDDMSFPQYGISQPFVHNGLIYAGMISYKTSSGQGDMRGLVEIDPVSFAINFHRPSYASIDNYYFGRPFLLQDDKIAMVHVGYGVAVFDTISKTWELFGNSNIAGFTKTGTELATKSWIQYDDLNDRIMVGDPGSGIIMFSVHGYMRQGYYSIGAITGGTWTFGTAGQLVQGFLDYDVGACVEPGSTTSMYCFWINEDAAAEKSIKWDKDGSSTDISDYIVGEVATEQSISGQEASLSFSVSHGHLFDPYNSLSLLSPILKKGRKLALRWGEKIAGTDYWQNAGTFYVTQTSLSFERGQYPTLKVNAEDQRCLWKNAHIYATSIYDNLPEYIIGDILTDFANIPVADINIPTFVSGTNLAFQWIETSIDEIMTQICERFGYYFRFDCDGKAHAKKISNSATIDHVYTDNTKLLKYSPDDQYSDFTNRVTVKGQERDFTIVTFAEEQVGTCTGTIGWWGSKADHKIWFSEDKSKRVINPRLEVIETTMSIACQLAGQLEEYLEECDAADDNKFCTVYVKAPNLLPVFIINLAGTTAACFIPDGVTALVGGVTIPIGRVVHQVGLFICMMILGSMSNYQYKIWGQPLGSVRRSVQATWNDTEHQTEINAVVEQTIDDPLSYSAGDCLAVATFEGMVAQMQRKRVKIEKIAHLQDEDGDTIQIIHPYSGATLTVYVASLSRTLKKAEGTNNDGYFLDKIEGWVCS